MSDRADTAVPVPPTDTAEATAAKTDPAELEAWLEEVQQASARLRDHRARRERAVAAEDAARQAVETARHRLTDEAEDVQRLESISLTRVWASLRGTRDERLDAERAEEQSARYAVAAAEARLEAAARDVRSVDAAIADLGDVEGRRARAYAAKEDWLRSRGGAAAADLVAVAERRGERWAEQTEIAEAAEATQVVLGALGRAAEALRSADGWSTYDTFLGGETLSSLAKHQKLDEAADRIRTADTALAHLSVELGDLGAQGVGEIGVRGMSRTFDIWFDNIFSDMAVAQHIRQARDRVESTLSRVEQVRGFLAERARFVEDDLDRLARRREQLLLGTS